MRCHIHTTSDGVKHLIPVCYGVIMYWHLPDDEALEFCTCPPVYKGPTKNDIISEQNNIINNLKSEIQLLKQQVKWLKDELHEKDC